MQQPPFPEPGNFAPPPPPQYPMPPRRPGRISRFIAWYLRQNILVKIIVALVGLFLLIFVGSAAIAGIADSNQQNLAATPTTVASQPTSAPTPAPTPTATPTVKQRIQQLVTSNATRTDKIDFPQNDGATVAVTLTLQEMLDTGDARSTIQYNCYNIEKALWTAHISALQDVNLAFRGPSTDKFGNPSTSPYGVCDLMRATAAKFNWDGLNAQSAWNVYDQAMFFAIIAG